MTKYDPIAQHRAEYRRKILLPVVLTGTFMLSVVVVLFVLTITDTMSTGQLSTISSFMVTLCVLIPLSIGLFLFTLLFVMTAVGIAQLPNLIFGPLEQARTFIGSITAMTRENVPKAAEPVVEFNSRLTRWEQMLTQLIRPTEEENHEQ